MSLEAQGKSQHEAGNEKTADSDRTAAVSSKSDNVRKVLCRGDAHDNVCGRCFFTDDRFGRHWNCERECAVINGVWGPTVCSNKCRRDDNLATALETDVRASGSEGIKKRIWRQSGKR